MSNEIAQLIAFLDSPREDVRSIALSHLLPFTATANGSTSKSLLSHRESVKRFANIAQSHRTVEAHDAIKALINLTADGEEVQKQLATDHLHPSSFLSWMIATLTKQDALLADPLAMLLSNLTKVEPVCIALLEVKTSSDRSAFEALTDTFIKGEGRHFNKDATYDFLASVLANLSTTLPGRQLLLKTPETTAESPSTAIGKISVFTEHPDIIRRGGVCTAIKNCCFSYDAHSHLLAQDGDNIIPRLLLPLCGPEEFDLDDLETLPEECQLLPTTKVREPDANIRLVIVEALIVLCATPSGRQRLRSVNTYRVVQMLHKQENDQQVKHAADRLARILISHDPEAAAKDPDRLVEEL